MSDDARPVGLASDLKSTSRLLTDAVVGITDIVEQMHATIVSVAPPVGAARAGRAGGIAGVVYRSVRGITRAVGGVLDIGLDQLAPLLDRKALPADGREAALSALNGVLGDYLLATGNPLAIPMQWRRDGVTLASSALAQAQRQRGVASGASMPRMRWLVLIHGLCMNDRQWLRDGHDHGAALCRELGYAPLYLRYNSGLPIADNGRQLAAMLEALVDDGPASDVDITLLGHSMGGLLARSALLHGAIAGQRWVDRCGTLVCLGTPHLGAPLERGGHALDRLLGVSPYSAPFARLGMRRSAGIQDLRHGRIGDAATVAKAASSIGRSRLLLIAASRQAAPTDSDRRPHGDGLVPVDSALGRHRDPARALSVPEAQRAIVHGHDHFELLSSREVYEQLLRWLR